MKYLEFDIFLVVLVREAFAGIICRLGKGSTFIVATKV
jgi:hypothetical protein